MHKRQHFKTVIIRTLKKIQMKTKAILFFNFLFFFFTNSVFSQTIFIEAESFSDKGGWVIDQQSMDVIGSSYLMAHGLGISVHDATTTIEVPQNGTYRIWVRTRNWVAPWAPTEDPPGKFQLLINDK